MSSDLSRGPVTAPVTASVTASIDPRTPASESAFLREVLATESAAIAAFSARIAAGELGSLHAALDLLESCRGHVVVSGMGKSGLVGAKISASLSSLGQPSHFVHPAEAVHGDLGSIRRDDVVLLLSWSGETQEVVALASILRMDGVPTLGMSGKAGSSLARAATVHVDLGDITEACPLNLAPTASTTPMKSMKIPLRIVQKSSKSVVWNQAITSMSRELWPKPAKRTITASGQIFGWARKTSSRPAITRRSWALVVP